MTSRVCVRGALCLFLAAGLARAQESDLLERVRDALGEPPDGIVTLTGASSVLGEEGSFESAFDAHGRFHRRMVSDLGMSAGYDGRTAWEIDWNRMPRVLELGDLDSSLLEAWALSGHWARGAAGVEIEELAPEGEEDARLRLTMSGGKLRAVVHLDEDTSLPAKIVIERPTGEETITLSDYERFDGQMIPTSVEVVAVEGQTSSAHVTEIASAPADAARFEPRLTPPADTRFDPAALHNVEVKRVPTGHLLVHPTVGGADLGWFIFDTGAGSNVISTTVAESLGLERIGQVTARGVGGAIETSFYRLDDLTLGPVTLEDQAFVGIDLAFLKPHFGVDVAGIVGYDMLARCVVEFDAAAPTIAIYDPGAYEAPEGVRWETLMLPDRVPSVIARFEGHEAPFRLDTGAAGDTVSFHAPAVTDLKLLDGRETTMAMAGGVGGMVPMRSGKVTSFTLGGRTFENLDVQFATERVGAFADPYTAGNVGGVVLGNFKLVLDYPNRRIGFIERDAE